MCSQTALRLSHHLRWRTPEAKRKTQANLHQEPWMTCCGAPINCSLFWTICPGPFHERFDCILHSFRMVSVCFETCEHTFVERVLREVGTAQSHGHRLGTWECGQLAPNPESFAGRLRRRVRLRWRITIRVLEGACHDLSTDDSAATRGYEWHETTSLVGSPSTLVELLCYFGIGVVIE